MIKKYDEEFFLNLKGYYYTLIRIYYFMPDYQNIVNEFIWQTLDLPPTFPRIHKFLNFWKENISAKIKEIEISCNYKKGNITKVDKIFDIN